MLQSPGFRLPHLLAPAHRDVLLGRNSELLGWLVECIQKEPAARRAQKFGSDRSCPRSRSSAPISPSALPLRSQHPATQRRALGTPDAGASLQSTRPARCLGTTHRREVPRRADRHPGRGRSPSHWTIGCSERPLVGEQKIARQALFLPGSRKVIFVVRPSPDACSPFTPLTDAEVSACSLEQLQPLVEIGRSDEIRQLARRFHPVHTRGGLDQRDDVGAGSASCSVSSHTVARALRRPPSVRDQAELWSAIWAAPAVITPGSVQPGIGNGRSSAPVARMTSRAWMRRAEPGRDTPISKLRTTALVEAGPRSTPSRRGRRRTTRP